MPLEQVSNSLTFYAFFTYTKQGVTGLTVTADVYRNGVSILTAQACTAVGGGLYSYTLASASVNAEGEYICLFKTSGTVDQQHIPAIWCIAKAGVEYLDAQVTSRMPTGNVTVGGYASTYDPGYGVWTYLTTNPQLANSFGDAVKTNLTAYTTTRAAKLDNLDTTISSRSSLIASDIWNYLTSGATVAGSIGKRIADYVDAAVSSRLATSGYTAPDNASIGTILSRTDVATSTRASGADYTTARAAKLDNLDATISSRLAPAGITNLQADVTAIKTPVVANLDATISSRLTPAGITSMQADVTAIKTPVVANLDATISSRLTPAGITSLQADVTAIKTPVVANVDATISSRLASSAYTPTTAMSADVATILSRTDVATSTRADGSAYTNTRAAKLDQLDVAVSSRVSAGTGSIAYTTTVTAPVTGAPIEGVAAWVTSDSAGLDVIAGTQYTSASGTCTFMLDAGSYYMWLQLSGWNFNNPTFFVVS